ncbi:MAG: universal stress protein [Alphaproteobacteria bacterium]
MFKRILIPTDGSPHAEQAVAVGCELAKRFESRLIFLHVLMHTAKADEIAAMPGVSEELAEQIRQSTMVPAGTVVGSPPITVIPPGILKDIGEGILQRAENTAAQTDIPGSKLKLKTGDPARCIVETAAEEEADAIVMGRRGLNRLESLIQGSTSERVGRTAECTFVTVH